MHRRRRDNNRRLKNTLVKRNDMEENDVKMIGVNDVCNIFNCEKQKARRILKVAFEMKYATKICRSIYMAPEDFSHYMQFIKGKNVII